LSSCRNRPGVHGHAQTFRGDHLHPLRITVEDLRAGKQFPVIDREHVQRFGVEHLPVVVGEAADSTWLRMKQSIDSAALAAGWVFDPEALVMAPVGVTDDRPHAGPIAGAEHRHRGIVAVESRDRLTALGIVQPRGVDLAGSEQHASVQTGAQESVRDDQTSQEACALSTDVRAVRMSWRFHVTTRIGRGAARVPGRAGDGSYLAAPVAGKGEMG
jgi:hypothetical protein